VNPNYIDTGMFEGVTTRFGFLLPILSPELVTRRIITATRRNTPELHLPWIVYTTDVLRGLCPTWLFDTIARVLGISVALEDFVQTRAHALEPAVAAARL
jgi:all-trans-retinol dehydrogenase (NAD+)